jgi:NAD(P)-dependent dehydrogenase (short-subunit alcohol dehydrogenase family)
MFSSGVVFQTETDRWYSQERFIAQFNTNLFGTINTTRALLPHFRAKKSGVIVYLGSLGGIAGEVGGAAYCASKFALEGRIPRVPSLSNRLTLQQVSLNQ